MCVIVLEAEKKTAAFIRMTVRAEYFAVDFSHNGNEALAPALDTSFDAVMRGEVETALRQESLSVGGREPLRSDGLFAL